MGGTGFASPEAALNGIRDCLASTFCSSANVHIGSSGSGDVIPCCQERSCGLLRIESVDCRPKDGEPAFSAPCIAIVLTVEVIWRQCLNVFGKDARNPRPTAELTREGLSIVTSWWAAMTALKNCSGTNQLIRLVEAHDDPPGGGCAGWTMSLAVDLRFCNG